MHLKLVRITVNTLSPASDDIWLLHVEVTESDGSRSRTRHKVPMDKEYYEIYLMVLLVQMILLKNLFNFF